MRVTSHAARQARDRGFDIADVVRVTRRKLTGVKARSAAVLVGWLREARGSLVGSNGNEVWAVVRDGELVTVMLRRSDQPKTQGALRVDAVIA